MKLFISPGACSMAGHILLNELALPHTVETVNLKTKTTDSGLDFLTINPRGYVPALQLDDGEIVTENPAVLLTIGGQKSNSLSPTPGTLAYLQQIELLSFLGSELHKAYGPFFGELSDEARPKADANFEKQLERTEALFSDGRLYLTGDQPTVSDIYAFVILNWTTLVGKSLSGYPKLSAFHARMAEKPAVQQTLREEGLLQ